MEVDITLVTTTEGPTSVLVGRIEELEEQVQLITLERDAATRVIIALIFIFLFQPVFPCEKYGYWNTTITLKLFNI